MNTKERTDTGRFKKGIAYGIQKGDKMPKEHKDKLKEAWHKNPDRKTVKGKRWKVSETAKINIRMGLKKRWDKIGRKEHKRYIHLTNTKEYREWRMQVFLRDNFTCQYCGIRGCYLEAHHIKSWAKYPELHFDINNGATLCLDCHKLTDNYRGKKNV